MWTYLIRRAILFGDCVIYRHERMFLCDAPDAREYVDP